MMHIFILQHTSYLNLNREIEEQDEEPEVVIPPQVSKVEIAEVVVPPTEINYFSSDEEEEENNEDDISFITLSSETIASEDSSRSGEPDEYDPETGMDDDSFIVNDM